MPEFDIEVQYLLLHLLKWSEKIENRVSVWNV